jgi:hypothetical protein
MSLVAQAIAIIESYQEQGYRLTLRQLYYQLVTRNLIPNEEKAYKRVGGLLSDARLAGLVDWAAIEDRVRVPQMPSEWSGLGALVRAALRSYRLPRWDGQDNYVELWVEKDALAGVLAPLAHRFHVTLMVNRGYSSQSAMYDASKRFLSQAGKRPYLLYLGDLDPSGEDMVRDVGDRLAMFGLPPVYDDPAHGLEVRKLALTPEQVSQYNPPPNPAKRSDSRSAKYIAEHGESSWEVDALPPNVLHEIIEGAIEALLDEDKMRAVRDREERDKAALIRAVALEGESQQHEYSDI